MNALRVTATIIMTAGFGFFGAAKIVGASVVTEGPGWSRLSEGQWALIGAIELVAVAGLLLAVHPRFRRLGIAAAAGLATLTASAVVYHVINSDPAGDIAPAVIQGAVATSYVVFGRRTNKAVNSTGATAGLVAA